MNRNIMSKCTVQFSSVNSKLLREVKQHFCDCFKKVLVLQLRVVSHCRNRKELFDAI